MRIHLPVIILVAVVLAASPTPAYEWYPVHVDSVHHPTYEIQFGGGLGYVGTEEGVFRGYGPPEAWEGMGLEVPGLGAYTVLYLEGSGWEKHSLTEFPLLGATGVAIEDLDRDAYADVVVTAKEPGDCVVWYENPLPLAPGPFWPMWDVDRPTDGGREVSIGDIDGDGFPDLAVAIRDEGEIVWYENVPTSHPMTWIRHHVGFIGGPRGVFVADIDGDERLDIVAGGMADNTVMWYEAPPDPSDSWTGYVVDDSLESVKGVFAHDMDRDGDLDIAAAGRGADDVVWYEHGNLGDPIPWTKHLIDTDLTEAVSVWCGDLMGNPMPEVAATGKLAGRVMVYTRSDESVDAWTPIVLDDALAEACPVSGGDIDGDGWKDVVAAGRSAGVVAWYRSPGESGTSWHKNVIDDAAGGCMGLTTGDVDNDGDLDIAATACSEGYVTWYENDLRDIYCGFSDGTGMCESDGIYHWGDIAQEWTAGWWCPRPYFLVQHPLLPDVYLCGNMNGLFVSSDLTHWTEMGGLTLPDHVRSIWFDPVNPDILMVGTNTGLYRTDTGGMHWTPVLEIPGQPVMDIESARDPEHPADPPLVYLTEGMGTFDDGLYRSNDLGTSWTRLDTFLLPTDLLQDVTIGPAGPFLFMGTTGQGIYRLCPDGTIIGDLNTGLPDLSIHRMQYDPFIDTPAIFACTEGGLYECLLLEGTEVAANPEPPSIRVMCHASPNPWSEGVAFRLDGLETSAPAKIAVYDLLGRRVWASEGHTSSCGTWTARWNGQSMSGRDSPPGVYVYRAEVSGRQYGGKIIRVR